MNCPRCNVEMKQTDITPIGIKPHDLLDNYYFIHPKSDCRVADMVIKMAYRV